MKEMTEDEAKEQYRLLRPYFENSIPEAELGALDCGLDNEPYSTLFWLLASASYATKPIPREKFMHAFNLLEEQDQAEYTEVLESSALV
ncbi:hypothetical protein I6E29_07825 [Arcanobacterium haemolyticum]|nr:hypothetical protein [Arcanobacterium haemolyticum]